jgi:hypothetical protein
MTPSMPLNVAGRGGVHTCSLCMRGQTTRVKKPLIPTLSIFFVHFQQFRISIATGTIESVFAQNTLKQHFETDPG